MAAPSRRLVFTDIFVTYDFYRDPSPTAQDDSVRREEKHVTLTSDLSPPKGETTHYILRVASAPSPTAVTDSLDFQVADASLQIQFA